MIAFWVVVWVLLQIYASISFVILLYVSYRMWWRQDPPPWVLGVDPYPGFIIGRIYCWPYFAVLGLIRYGRRRLVKARHRAVTVRRTDA